MITDFVRELAREITPALMPLRPGISDGVVGHEAVRIAQAIAPLVITVHDPTGKDHLAELETHARLADSLITAMQRALEQLEDGELHEAECILQHAFRGTAR